MRWISFPPAVERRDSVKWVLEIARVPAAIVRAVRSKASGATGSPGERDEALESWKLLEDGAKDRYRRLFQFCGIPARE